MKKCYYIPLFLIILLSGNNTFVYAIQSLTNLSNFSWDKVNKYSLATFASPIIYQEIPDPSRPLNTTLKVGRIEGVADVSSTGAATYQIPIKVLDGTGQMQPLISVNYNSQSRNGIMGYGWNLSAASAITRIGKNYYYDGLADELKLNTSDNLMLDGKRLMLVSGNNFMVGSVYAPEIEDYSIVEYVTINSRDAFRVRTKDGLISEYGTNSDSYIQAQNSTSALYWLLSKVTDRHGNYMLYHYETNISTGEFYLSSIEYTGNSSANTSPYNRVEFTYSTRDDVIDSYVAGNVVSQKILLTSIKCINNGIAVNEYKFKYIFDHYYSKLSEIEEYGLNGARYNSTVVNWGEYNDDYSKNADEYFSYVNTGREGIYPNFEDFNGDGMADMMTFPTKTPSSYYNSSDNAVLYLAYSMYGNISFTKKCSIPLIKDFLSLIYVDLNGDGKLDVVRLHKAGNNNYRFEYFIFNGESFTNTGGFNNSDSRIIVGDFNGDGKMELLTRDIKVYDASATVIASGGIDNWGSEYLYCYPNNNYVVDFNGDGKSDILVMNSSSSWVYTLIGNTFIKLTSFNSTGLKNWSFNYFGDFNGDGKTDVLCQNSNNVSDVALYLSTGRSFIKKQVSNHDIKAKVFVGDYNRDGKDEIIHLDPPSGNTNLRIKVGTFNGVGFDNEYYNSALMKYSDIKENLETGQSNIAIKDFDGDGRVEFMLSAYADMNFIYAFNDKLHLQVDEIVDGYNKQVGFQYVPITASGCYSETNVAVSFPVVKARIPLYVVSSKTSYAGNYSQTLLYKYRDLCVHRQGKGIICFKEIEETDYNKKIKTINSYGYYSPGFISYFFGRTMQMTSGSYISEQNNYYDILSVGNKRYEIQLTTSYDYDILRDAIKVLQLSDYSYGNPQYVLKGAVVGSEIQCTEEHTIIYKNIATSNLRLLGLPSQETITKIYNDKAPYEEKVETNYSNDFDISKKTFCANGANRILEENYTYDTFGNILTRSSKPYNSINPLTVIYKYSANGQHVIESTDVYGFKTVYAYNERGKRIQATNYRNHITRYEYDDMGDLVKTIYPDNIVETNIISWAQSAPQAMYSVTQTSTVKPTNIVYYNIFDKIVRAGTTQFDGKVVYTDTYYDRNCLLQKISLPFTGTSATLWDTYTYDEFDRLIKIQYASGKEDSFSYSNMSITETKDGITTTRTTDITGKLIKVSDESGTITYSYLSNGNPDTIRISDDIYTTFTYDNHGRQINITDPSAGTLKYEYDMYGNKNKEIDARGKIISYTFDKFGRILTRITPETTYTYTYDSDQRLVSVSGNNGTSFTYTYDPYGNVLTEKESGVDNKWLQKNYSYSNGILTGTTYSSQTETILSENYTYANRHLKTVKLGNTTIWDLQAADVFGHPTKIVTGNITRNYTYNLYGFPTGRTASSTLGGTFLNSSYSFNSVNGNLNFRKDLTRNLIENFEYDSMNRLTGYENTTISYSNLGNILSKSDAGTLGYDGYKIQTITPISDLYNTLSKQQDVSYTSFMRPNSITENGYQATFSYNANNQRVKMQINKGENNYLTRYYLGNIYEIDDKVGGTKEKLYLGGNYYDAYAVYVKQNGSWQLNYICRDYLGSITHITNDAGALLVEYSYDAWGRLRNPVNQSIYALGAEPELLLGRGYTGHEHLAIFGLVNMNARLYDPTLGRFLSPDPYVQLPDNLQGFNRYTYGMNNPLCYVDENGEFWWFVAAAVVGGIINVATNWNNIDNIWQGLGYFGVGAVAGAASFATGGAVTGALGGLTGIAGGAIVGMTTGATSGFVLGGGNAVLSGGNFNDFMSGATTGMFSGAFQGFVSGSISGGIVSYLQGKSIWTGADIANSPNSYSITSSTIETTVHPKSPIALPEELSNTTPAEIPPPTLNDSPTSLTHYTTEQGYNSIMESGQLLPSTGPIHARFGDGQYLTDINSLNFTAGQVSRRLYGVPWNTNSLTHYIKIDVTGLNVIRNIPHNYLIPNNQPLNISNRILGGGITIFKIKF